MCNAIYETGREKKITQNQQQQEIRRRLAKTRQTKQFSGEQTKYAFTFE